jgi:hypothetical protein
MTAKELQERHVTSTRYLLQFLHMPSVFVYYTLVLLKQVRREG